jgi:hypothetical protein
VLGYRVNFRRMISARAAAGRVGRRGRAPR